MEGTLLTLTEYQIEEKFTLSLWYWINENVTRDLYRLNNPKFGHICLTSISTTYFYCEFIVKPIRSSLVFSLISLLFTLLYLNPPGNSVKLKKITSNVLKMAIIKLTVKVFNSSYILCTVTNALHCLLIILKMYSVNILTD